MHCVIDSYIPSEPPPFSKNATNGGNEKRCIRRDFLWKFPEAAGRGIEKREDTRISVNLLASLQTGGSCQNVTILDVSRSGARVKFSDPFGYRNNMCLVVPSLGSLHARGVWNTKDTVGLRFAKPFEEIEKLAA